jgi:hypothetical protein
MLAIDVPSGVVSGEILAALSDAALFESEDNYVKPRHRTMAARLHLELEQLLERMSELEEYLMTEPTTGGHSNN